MGNLWSGWTPPRTEQPCWAGLFSGPGGKMAVCLRTHLHFHCHFRCHHHFLLQPFAPWSSGLDSSPGEGAPHHGGDTPVVVPFLSHWRPGLCRHGRHIGNHAESEPNTNQRYILATSTDNVNCQGCQNTFMCYLILSNRSFCFMSNNKKFRLYKIPEVHL